MARRSDIGRTRRTTTPLDRLRGQTTVTVPEAAEVLGISRNSAYAAVQRGELPALRIGRRTVIGVPALLKLLGVEGDNR